MNFPLSLISILIAALLGYLGYSVTAVGGSFAIVIAVLSFISTAVCLVCGLGLSWKSSRHKINAAVVSVLFLLLFIVELGCFALWGEKPSWPIITTGLLLLFYTLIVYAISKIKM